MPTANQWPLHAQPSCCMSTKLSHMFCNICHYNFSIFKYWWKFRKPIGNVNVTFNKIKNLFILNIIENSLHGGGGGGGGRTSRLLARIPFFRFWHLFPFTTCSRDNIITQIFLNLFSFYCFVPCLRVILAVAKMLLPITPINTHRQFQYFHHTHQPRIVNSNLTTVLSVTNVYILGSHDILQPLHPFMTIARLPLHPFMTIARLLDIVMFLF